MPTESPLYIDAFYAPWNPTSYFRTFLVSFLRFHCEPLRQWAITMSRSTHRDEDSFFHYFWEVTIQHFLENYVYGLRVCDKHFHVFFRYVGGYREVIVPYGVVYDLIEHIDQVSAVSYPEWHENDFGTLAFTQVNDARDTGVRFLRHHPHLAPCDSSFRPAWDILQLYFEMNVSRGLAPNAVHLSTLHDARLVIEPITITSVYDVEPFRTLRNLRVFRRRLEQLGPNDNSVVNFETEDQSYPTNITFSDLIRTEPALNHLSFRGLLYDLTTYEPVQLWTE